MSYEIRPIKLTPFVADYIWGGSKLKMEWGKNSDFDRIAETWELSVYPGKESKVYGGKYDGILLSELLILQPGIFGKKVKDFSIFPLLIKIINSEQPLSIQVHPDDTYALFCEGQLGKTEIWYIAEAMENAYIYLGFNKTLDRDELLYRLKNGSIIEVLNKINVKKGDLISVEPGTVHALQPGTVVIEIQENSNVTYRLYDYGRTDANGKERPLHIEKALDVINLDKLTYNAVPVFASSDEIGTSFNVLAKNKYFCAYQKLINNCSEIYCDYSFVSITVLSGQGYFASGEMLKKGDTYIIPAGFRATLFLEADCPEALNIIAVTLSK